MFSQTLLSGNKRSVSQSRFRKATLLAAIGSVNFLLSPDSKADSTWIVPAGTPADYNNNANWDNGVPTGTVNAILDNGGTVLIQPADPDWTVFDIRAGNSATGSGTYLQSGGNVTANSWFRLAAGGPNSVGNYNLSGGTFTGHGNVRIGESGTGTLYVSGGMFSADGSQNQAYWGIGTNDGSNGTLTIVGGVVEDSAPNDGAPFRIADSGKATGTVNLSGTGVINADSNEFWVGNSGIGYLNQMGGSINVNNYLSVGRSGGTGTVNMSGGVLNVGSNGFFQIGDSTGATGTFFLSNTAAVNVVTQTWIGSSGGNGTLNISGGTFTDHNWIAIGRQGGNGVVNLTGGTLAQDTTGNITFAGNSGILNQTGGLLTTVNETYLGEQGGQNGVWNMSGGVANVGNVYVGRGGNGTLNVSGTAALTANVVHIATAVSSNGTLNLNGGTLSVASLVGGASTGNTAVNLNGGTLQATGNSSVFLHGFQSGQVKLLAGGGTIDTQSFSVSAEANLSGVGGLTKVGSGTLALSGSSTYTGRTTIKSGTLQVGSTTYTNSIKAAGVAAYYPFNSTSGFNDVSGNGNNLIDVYGSGSISTASPTAANGGSLSLPNNNSNTTADYLTTSNGIAPSNFPLGNSSYTIGAWVNTDGTQPRDGILGYGGYSGNDTNAFRTDGNTGLLNYWYNADLGGTTASSVANNWNYVAVTYDAATDVRTLYFDGTAVASDTPGVNNASSGNFAVGRTETVGYGASEYFSGNLADLLVTTSALTPAQLQAAATNGVSFSSTSTANGSLSASSPIAIASGASLDLNGTSQTIGGLADFNIAGGGLVINSVAGTNSVLTLAPSSLQTYSGAIQDGAGTLSLVINGTANQTLSGVNTYSGATNVASGTLTLASKTALPSGTALVVGSGASLVAGNLGLNSKNALSISSLSIAGTTNAWTGKVDLTNNDLIIHNAGALSPAASLTQVTNEIKSGYANGTWSGQGITSSVAANDSTHLTALGVIQNSVGTSGSAVYTSFDGRPVTASDVLVKYTYYGDANISGTVDGSDYTLIDNGYLMHATGWMNGDFNYDGVIDGSDYTLIDNAFNTQGAQIQSLLASPTAEIAVTGNVSAVPEPASLGLLGIGAAAFLSRRRRR